MMIEGLLQQNLFPIIVSLITVAIGYLDLRFRVSEIERSIDQNRQDRREVETIIDKRSDEDRKVLQEILLKLERLSASFMYNISEIKDIKKKVDRLDDKA